MFELLLERRMAELRHTAGVISATVANAAPFTKRERAITAEDFFPDHRKDAERERQEVEKQIAFLSTLMGCGPNKPGTVH